MPTILTDEQKNYVFMLLAGGPLPQNEIRMFLARSGWSLDQIDAGVAYSQDEQLQNMLASLQPASAAAQAAQPVATSIVINSPVQEPSVAVAETTRPQVSQPVPDMYRESADVAQADFGKLVQSNPGLSTKMSDVRAPSIPVASSMQTAQSTSAVLMQNPVRTMPAAPKKSLVHGILVFIAWLLLFVLVALVAAILGYMYYTGSGIFETIEYSKLLPRL